MTKSLKEELEKYIESNAVRFHMPGHSGEEISPIYASAKYDVTELDFNDNLNCPTDVLLDLEKRIASFCKVDRSLISTTGTTTSILIGLGALRAFGKVIAIDQFSHKSVFEAARRWGYKIKIIPRTFDKEGIAEPLTEESIRSFIDLNPDISVISFTDPGYLGEQTNQNIPYDYIREKNIKIFIDAAHSAHFRMHYLYRYKAHDYIDVFVESWHKTLPVYTGGSILHINDKTGDIIDRALLIRAKVHTSSPSYLTMVSIEESLNIQEKWAESCIYENIFVRLLKIADDHPNFKVLSNPYASAKLTINADYNEFIKHGIQPETHWGRWTNFIITPFNFAQVEKIDELLYKLKPITKISPLRIPKCPKILPKPISPDSTIKYVDLDDAIGHISAADVGAYPPGVPILYEGQKITKAHIAFLKKTIGHTFNLNQGKIAILNS